METSTSSITIQNPMNCYDTYPDPTMVGTPNLIIQDIQGKDKYYRIHTHH